MLKYPQKTITFTSPLEFVINILNYCYSGEPVSDVTKKDADIFTSLIQNNNTDVDILTLANEISPSDDYYSDIINVFVAHDTLKTGRLNLQQYLDAMSVLREHLL